MVAKTYGETQELFEIIRMKLHLSSNATITKGQPVIGTMTPDLVIEEGNKKFFVEIKTKANMDIVARMALLKELLQKQKERYFENYFVIASEAILPDAENIAKQTGVMLVLLPHGTAPTVHRYEYLPGKVKITSEKSWMVVCQLLKEKTASIRKLSLLANVSYGWAYATIQSLIVQGIAEKKGNYVTISDVDKLLNGVAWERPFENLFSGKIYLGYEDSSKAARELSHMLHKRGLKFAFTGYTAGGVYTSYGVRHDTVYLYLEKKHIPFFMETFADKEERGVQARVYLPDREIFEYTKLTYAQEGEGIRIASPEQTLLDLAGLGYSGRDMAKAMADKYAAI